MFREFEADGKGDPLNAHIGFVVKMRCLLNKALIDIIPDSSTVLFLELTTEIRFADVFLFREFI